MCSGENEFGKELLIVQATSLKIHTTETDNLFTFNPDIYDKSLAVSFWLVI